MLESLVRTLAYPLWDLKDHSQRLSQHASLLRSQWQSREALEALRLQRLRSILEHAYAHCSFYRGFWGALPQPDRPEDLRSLPIVTKGMVRDGGAGMIASTFRPDELVQAKTGGSTGTALTVYFDRRCEEWRNAAAMRSDGWAGWRPGMWVAALWGTPPVPKTIKQRIRNELHDRLFFLDTMNMSPDAMRAFAKELERRRPGGLFGHAHSLFVFARFVEEQGLVVPRMSAVIATSMMLLENERDVIARVFGCVPTNRYGCEEVGLIACECERHAGLHVNAEHVYVEILRPNGEPVAPGEEGAVVVTDLVNRGMPLVRYAIEDMAVWSDRECGCGRKLPLIERLVGRRADFLVRADGSQVAGVSLVEKTLTAIPGIEQMQIVQSTPTALELFVVKANAYSSETERRLIDVLQEIFGKQTEVTIRVVERIPQERNGKYRFAICRVPQGGSGD